MKNVENKSGWKLWVGLGAGLLTGVAAGIATGLFLNSDRGKKFRWDAERRVGNLTKEVDDAVRRELDDLSSRANEALERTKAYAEKAKTTLREKFEHFSES